MAARAMPGAPAAKPGSPLAAARRSHSSAAVRSASIEGLVVSTAIRSRAGIVNTPFGKSSRYFLNASGSFEPLIASQTRASTARMSPGARSSAPCPAPSGVRPIVTEPSILNENRPVKEEVSHGICLPFVDLITWLRTSIIMSEMLNGLSIWASSAEVNGLFRPSPSCATLSGSVAYAMNVPWADGTRLNPRPSVPTARVPRERVRLL